jgi:Sulfotransferase family
MKGAGMSVNPSHPVAIGGVGGSGTRVGAALLQMLGYYIGDDLNEPLDNLWFTLLFKRRSVLLESEPEFVQLVSLFRSRMSGETCLSDEQRARVFQLCGDGRLQHPQAWLVERAESFFNAVSSKRAGQPWAWKEPNTHIVIDRIFQCEPELRYIHFVRHPLDMALSGNQNQLENWGPIMLSREVAIEPRQSLAYWCAAHRRVLSFFARWPARTLMVDFDALCANPGPQCVKISDFLGAELSDEVKANFCELVDKGRPVSSRFATADLGQFDPIDLSYLASCGYAV